MSIKMLQRFIPRLSTQARQHFLRPSVFPRHPVFFSTTARQFNSLPTEPGSTNATTSKPSEHVAGTTVGNTEEEPTPTDLESHPASISCTVSPPETYAFLKPMPVVLLTGPFGGNWCFRDTWQASLADQGYQSTSIEFTMPPKKLESGEAYIRYFTNVLKTSIETDHSFYPPILIAHGMHALVAQKYVESNPVSALVLVSPFIPEIIKGRFSGLSRKLQLQKLLEQSKQQESKENEAHTATTPSSSPTTVTETVTATATATGAATVTVTATATATATAAATDLPVFDFKTHADVLAQDGFRETFVLPKKAVYKIDQIAKELQEKEKSKEKEQNEKEASHIKVEDADLKSKHAHEDISSSNPTTSTEALAEQEIEVLGTDSDPVWGSAEDGSTTKDSTNDGNQEPLPIMTVESEASIPSPLEQLPLAIYDSIPTSKFEPTFPILLVTSNADEIVSTADVKKHHVLSGHVDHIELEDLDDGGHLIMVSDNTEWEQGIQGITAWLDSEGM
ncbi:hypothetical protein BGX21_002763 [Mortierella sp. AD011]|nr:hypothetical protein BGX20_001433 [Mortierella sp. AD010]KAF9401078.1 hypothetical protein BGX21_002763 [Mortierella sp. AD011]